MLQLQLHLIVFVLLEYVYASSDCEIVTELWRSFGKRDYIGQDGSTISIDPTNSASCCSMIGVSCSMSTVIGIDWHDQTLNGPLLNQIGQLESLETLSLGVGISGDIPCSISILPKLKKLNLQDNANLGGSITTTNSMDININNTKIVNCNRSPHLAVCKNQPICIHSPPNTQNNSGDWRLPVYICIALVALFFIGMIFLCIYRDYSGYKEWRNRKRKRKPLDPYGESPIEESVSSKTKKLPGK